MKKKHAEEKITSAVILIIDMCQYKIPQKSSNDPIKKRTRDGKKTASQSRNRHQVAVEIEIAFD